MVDEPVSVTTNVKNLLLCKKKHTSVIVCKTPTVAHSWNYKPPQNWESRPGCVTCYLTYYQLQEHRLSYFLFVCPLRMLQYLPADSKLWPLPVHFLCFCTICSFSSLRKLLCLTGIFRTGFLVQSVDQENNSLFPFVQKKYVFSV